MPNDVLIDFEDLGIVSYATSIENNPDAMTKDKTDFAVVSDKKKGRMFTLQISKQGESLQSKIHSELANR